MKKKSFSIILILLGFSLNSCSPTLMTNLLTVDNGRNYTRKTSSSQVKGRSNTGRVNSSQVKSKEKSNDERENRNISKASGNVVLTCLGEGSSLSEATSNALRSGIEQTYGAFVSSNTTILNDRIVKDEIVSVSSGNIVAYEVKSQNHINNKWNVVVQAEISQSKLARFAQSKGASVDINTSALAMNIKMARFYTECEKKAFVHLGEQLKELAPFCMDYVLKTTEPVKWYEKGRGEVWIVNTWLGYKENANYKVAQDLIKETKKSLSMTKEEAEKFRALGEKVYTYLLDNGEEVYLRTSLGDVVLGGIGLDRAYRAYENFYFDMDILLSVIAEDNYVLYRDGKDITTPISEYSDKKFYDTGGIYRADGTKEVFYGRYGKGLSLINKTGEHWFAVCEVVLSLSELEGFKANYQIHSKVKK